MQPIWSEVNWLFGSSSILCTPSVVFPGLSHKTALVGSSLEVRYDQRHGNNIDCDVTIKAKLVCRLMIVVGQLTATY